VSCTRRQIISIAGNENRSSSPKERRQFIERLTATFRRERSSCVTVNLSQCIFREYFVNPSNQHGQSTSALSCLKVGVRDDISCFIVSYSVISNPKSKSCQSTRKWRDRSGLQNGLHTMVEKLRDAMEPPGGKNNSHTSHDIVKQELDVNLRRRFEKYLSRQFADLWSK